MTPVANSYFSGGGLFDIGLKQAGIRVQQSLDIDPEATSVMKMNPHYHDHEILTEDITRKTVLDQPKCNIMAFTWPCTNYSTAADINSSRTGDELYLHAFRHQVISGVEAFVHENVPGLRKFKVVMEAISKLPHYYITVICPVKAQYWLPQDRKRLIVIGTKKPFFISHPNYANNRTRMKDIVIPGAEVDMPNYVHTRLKGGYRDKPIIVDPDDPGAIAPCCVAHYSKDMGTRLVKDPKSRYGVRPFTIREYARLQGVPDDYVFPEKRSSYKIIGNGVPVPMARWVGQQLMNYFN